MRLNKPIGIFLLLWPTLWALWIASEGHPNPLVLCVFIIGVVIMRSVGCVINDYADRELDAKVERTRSRPIPANTVTADEALAISAFLTSLAFLLVLLLNPLTVLLSIVALLLAATYPFMKRFTYLPQFYLGLAFSWAIPMAFAAQTDSIPQIAWLLVVATVLWAGAYDTMYAMVDREDDLKAGIKSTAILFDDVDRFIIGIIQVLMLVVLVIIGHQAQLGIAYYAGVGIAAALAGYQQYLIKDRKPERCFHAFLNNNWFGAAIFCGLFIHYQFGAS
ncbi:MAG: 4-hydroxybenzoate octaprenyltransferase [Gammaproteobacteria bacterium]|nr:4-hydroxybenzoate octaprenyltransferase [Gammaproteobacteria bacterium]MCI0590106.1 4-hydroxybenzoate octaprenyltransferase [Gammaproteobacteria bacterium]